MTLSTQTLTSDMEEQIFLPNFFYSVPCSFNTEDGTMEKRLCYQAQPIN